MEPLQILIAWILLAIHSIGSATIFLYRKKLDTKIKKNLVAVYILFLISMLAFMFNNFLWNFLMPELWIEKFVHVWVNPIDMFSALLTAIIIRAIFGQMELV